MTCIPFTCDEIGVPGIVGIVCMDDYEGRLHVGNKYFWVSHHRYCGPTFFTDRDMENIYEPEDEDDPIWPVFEAWLDKRERCKNNKSLT